MTFKFDHHTAPYNALRIAEELTLLEDHYVGDRCLDCVTKHLLRVRAYAIEGAELPNSHVKPLLSKARELAERHLRLAHLEGSPDKIPSMVEEVRSLRKEIAKQLFGVDVTVSHHH